jgi:hypothetical protein
MTQMFHPRQEGCNKKEIGRFKMPVFLKKCTTQIGLPIPFLYPKRIENGGCVLIILLLIRHVEKIP